MIIYRLTNKETNQVYIGLSSKTWQKRKYVYNAEIKMEHNKRMQRPVLIALREYGWEGFNVELLHEGVESMEKLRKLEKHYIKLHDSTDPEKGYNLYANGGIPNAESSKRQAERALKTWETRDQELWLKQLQEGKARYNETERGKNHGHWAAKRYILEHKDGALIEVTNLKKFCKDNGIATSNLFATKDSRKAPWWAKGWCLKERLGKP